MKLASMAELKSRMNQSRLPQCAVLELFNDCNLRCLHCYIPESARKIRMSFEQARKIIDDLFEAGTLELVISGGEAMMHPDIFKILDYIRDVRMMRVILFSNATLLTERLIDRFAEYSFLKFDITLYGWTRETYIRVTGRDVRDNVYRNVVRLHQKGIEVDIKTQVLRENFEEFDQVRGFAEGLGLPFRYNHYIVPDWEGRRAVQTHLIGEDQVVSLVERAGDVMEKEECERLLGERGSKEMCGLAKSTVGIMADGSVLPCITMRKPVGNIFETPFHKIWEESPGMLEAASLTFERISGCSSCQLQKGCNHCPGNAYENNGTYYRNFEQVCQLTEAKYGRRQERDKAAAAL